MTLPRPHALHEALEATWPEKLHAGCAGVGSARIHAAPLAALAMDAPEPTASFHIWEPLAIQCEIWAAGGIGASSLAVMHRAKGARTALLGRRDGHAVAAGFAAMHGGVAMVHALQVRPEYRRQGVARALVLEAARWAAPLGARYLAMAFTGEEREATDLAAALGLQPAAQYSGLRQPQNGQHE